MLQFQKAIGIEAKKTLGVIRTMILACGAGMGRDGNQMMVRLSLAGKRREWFRGYCDKILHCKKTQWRCS